MQAYKLRNSQTEDDTADNDDVSSRNFYLYNSYLFRSGQVEKMWWVNHKFTHHEISFLYDIKVFKCFKNHLFFSAFQYRYLFISGISHQFINAAFILNHCNT